MQGTIEDCDFTFALLHGYEDTQDVIGLNIKKITPALVLPTPGAPLGKVPSFLPIISKLYSWCLM